MVCVIYPQSVPAIVMIRKKECRHSRLSIMLYLGVLHHCEHVLDLTISQKHITTPWPPPSTPREIALNPANPRP